MNVCENNNLMNDASYSQEVSVLNTNLIKSKITNKCCKNGKLVRISNMYVCLT